MISQDIIPPAHPWRNLDQLSDVPASLVAGQAVSLESREGACLGSGVFDPNDALAHWRRFSLLGGVDFDEGYVAAAIMEALGRRADESCQRLVSSDADFLPGLIVERYQDVLTIQLGSAAVAAKEEVIVDLLADAVGPVEIVLLDQGGVRTRSGQNIKPRWINIDDLNYRIDLLKADRPGFPLILREQHALFGSLCQDRRVLDAFSDCGAFALQAARNNAVTTLVQHTDAVRVKSVGANAQKNNLRVDCVCLDLEACLEERGPAAFDAIALDLCESKDAAGEEFLEAVLHALAEGGILAVYAARGPREHPPLESRISRAVASAGREARLFARVGQPFDFPVLLNFPESQLVEGLLLEVL